MSLPIDAGDTSATSDALEALARRFDAEAKKFEALAKKRVREDAEVLAALSQGSVAAYEHAARMARGLE